MRNLWTITIWELSHRKWTILWWVLGIGTYVSINLLAYSSISAQSAELNDALKGIPDSAKAFLTDTQDFISPIGYLSSKVFYLMLPLLMSFMAISVGSSLLAREESRGTIELLLARPISRTTLLLGKALAGLLVISGVAVGLGIIIVAEVQSGGYDGVSTKGVALATLAVVAMATLFGAFAYMLSAWGRFGRGISIGLTMVIALGGYVASSLATQVDWLEWPAKLLPYHYYHPSDLLSGHGSWWPTLVYFVISVGLVAIAAFGFRRRDLQG